MITFVHSFRYLFACKWNSLCAKATRHNQKCSLFYLLSIQYFGISFWNLVEWFRMTFKFILMSFIEFERMNARKQNAADTFIFRHQQQFSTLVLNLILVKATKKNTNCLCFFVQFTHLFAVMTRSWIFTSALQKAFELCFNFAVFFCNVFLLKTRVSWAGQMK